MQQKQILFQHKKLVYYVAGQGQPVVLLHGFGEDSAIWKEQVAFLQPHFQLIIPDLPGSGQSEMADDMSLEGLADGIHDLLDGEGISTCILIGHSMGGYVTLAFVEKYSDRLKGFGLFHSTAFADSEEKKANRQKGIRFIQEHGAYEFLKTSIPNLYSPATKETRPALIEQQLQAVKNFSAAALTAYYQSMIARPDRTHLLKQTNLPVLFILGKWDTAVPLEDGLKQCHMPQLSYIHVLSHSGHMGMVEEVEKCNGILKKFVSVTLQQATRYE
jgi:pimeloyl-ACP methyl ester carboxylesterase